MFVKLFKYLRFVPQLDLLVNVLSKAAGPVLIFMVCHVLNITGGYLVVPTRQSCLA